MLINVVGGGDKTKQANSNPIILRTGGKKKQKCGLGLFDLIDWKFWREVKRWAMRSERLKNKLISARL